MELIIVWLLATMHIWSPTHREHFVPEARETVEQADARYREIAEAIVQVAFDPATKPLFQGASGRVSTAMFVATMFYTESGFRRDVDLGTSHVRLRHEGLNDFGRSWCMGQINLGHIMVDDPQHPGAKMETSAKKTMEGWTGPELLADRTKCVRATISIMRMSIGECRGLPMNERLASYAAGTCDSEKGRALSINKMMHFSRWDRRNRPHVKDTAVLKEISDANQQVGGGVPRVLDGTVAPSVQAVRD